MAVISMKIPALERAIRSVCMAFQATAATIDRSINRAISPMKKIGISITAIFRRSGISLTSISEDSSASRNSR